MIVIRVRFDWIPATPEWRGAIRASDGETWDTARWCGSCLAVGYDHGNIDAVLEAQRLGVESRPRVVACTLCGKSTCDACCEPTGARCRTCSAEGPRA